MTYSKTRLLALTEQASARYGIPAGLLEGLIAHESGWNPAAIGRDAHSVDRGIAQINSRAHPDISQAEAEDPAFAIPWAARTLSEYAKVCGGWEGALNRYNSGGCSGDASYAAAVLRAAKAYGYQPSAGTSPGLRLVLVLLLLGLVVAVLVS